MGKVYEAEERLSRRRVALKVLAPELSRSEDARRMFLNEMTILAQLDHPNIVRSLASTEVDGDLVLALELLEGQTLRQHLAERGRLPWSEAVAVTAQVASALGAAHQQEPAIIHRDLKPENLMVLPTGRIKVMDFGIAKVLQAISASTTHSVGTLQYMSPEQIDAAPVDARSDLYSLGLILYEMLAGRPPFESPSPRALLDLQCTAEPPPLPDEVRATMPRGVDKVMRQLLGKQADERPASAEALLTALEPFATADDTIEVGRAGQGDKQVGEAADPATGSGEAARQGNTSVNGSANGSAKGSANDSGPVNPSGAMATGRPAAQPLDTVALLERAERPREISAGTAVVALILLCVVAGVVTYLWRVRSADGAGSSEPVQVSSPVGSSQPAAATWAPDRLDEHERRATGIGAAQ